MIRFILAAVVLVVVVAIAAIVLGIVFTEVVDEIRLAFVVRTCRRPSSTLQ